MCADELNEILASANRVVFFGGAGVSTESGIPDFRSATGLYKTRTGGEYPPEYMLSHSCWADHPADFYAFYRANMLHPEAKPNAAHFALARLEQAGKLTAVVTQNIDGLHQMAGSKKVFELHGSVLRNHCVNCGHSYAAQVIADAPDVPKCTECGGVIKPDVVLYEEGLDGDVMDGATRAIMAADVLVVGGTSLNVYPAAGLLQYYRGDQLVLVNKSATSADGQARLVIHDSVGKVLGEATDQVLGRAPKA